MPSAVRSTTLKFRNLTSISNVLLDKDGLVYKQLFNETPLDLDDASQTTLNLRVVRFLISAYGSVMGHIMYFLMIHQLFRQSIP